MENLLINFIISLIMVILTTIIFYEIFRYVWFKIPKLKVRPRNKLLYVVLSIFIAHTLCVWAYGICYHIMVEHLNLGTISGDLAGSFMDYIYFSAETYSSLGMGDIYPTGNLRFISGVEVLNGLVMIGWSASFTYLAMERFWDMHSRKK